MDTLTQGLLGALAAQALLPARRGRVVWIAGAAGGMLPDADVLLRPWSDPALPWELHRHATHAYLLAPVVGLAAGALLLALPSFRRAWRVVLAAAVLGALTHAPLDLCTSYGTKVHWPFSHENATLDLFPIVDPLFTLVLALGVGLAARRRSRVPAIVAAGFVALYTGVAVVQHGAALDVQATLARARGHVRVRGRAMPLPGSLIAWRSLYEVEGSLVADTLRITPWAGTRVRLGGRLPLLREDAAVRGSRDPERVRSVFRRYAVFADGWVARVPDEPQLIGDMRFTLEGFRPPWALRLATSPGDPPVRWETRSFGPGQLGDLLAVIAGTAGDLQAVSDVASPAVR
jgi:inner membrane protein